MGKREEERKFKIDLLRKEILEAWDINPEADLRRIEYTFCFKLGISRRTFKEYLDIALYLIHGTVKGIS